MILLERQTGVRGLLLEYDAGLISPKHNTQFITEVKNLQSQKMFDFQSPKLYAVMQKYGVENKNGRIYPEALMRREVEKYMELVQMGASTGESDHAECFSEGAEILTVSGWKNLKDIDKNETIFTLSPQGKLEKQSITKKIAQHYKGKMIRLQGLNINCEVTPNHRFLIMKRDGSSDYVTAQQILDKSYPDIGHCYIPKVATTFDEFDNPNFIIEGIKEFTGNSSNDFRERMSKDLIYNAKAFCEFLGIYLAEGHCSSEPRNYAVYITQVKEPSKIQIREMLVENGFNFKEQYWQPTNKTQFVIRDMRLHKYLKKLGKALTKYIPQEIKDLPKECLEGLIEWFHIGDGRTRYGRQKSIFSTSERMMDDFQEVLLKIGKSGNITLDKRTIKDRVISEGNTLRIIKAKNSHNIHNLNISNTKGIYLNRSMITVESFDYEGNIYCVQVPNSNFYVRQNSRAHWSGNSAVIAIQNVAMRVTNLWWEGRTLMGEIYLPITRGFIESGVISHHADKIANDIMHGFQYGVSSRGVGSLEVIKGQNIVQDDFEIICWDFVTTPSTHGSWVFTDKNATQPFIESSESSDYEKSSVIQNINSGLPNKKKDVFDYFSDRKKASIDDALNRFMTKF